jgi:hypothetical protein
MKYIYIAILSILLNNQVIAQIKVLDSKTKEMIPFAHIIASNGNLLGTSNGNGLFNKLDLLDESLASNDTLVIQHVAYENLKISTQDFLLRQELLMTPRNYSIKEVVISNKQPEYLVLKGYFRCYGFDDSSALYFTDGIAEFYFRMGSKNRRWEFFKLIEARTYRNESRIKRYYKTRFLEITQNGLPAINSHSSLASLGSTSTRDSLGVKIHASPEGLAKVKSTNNRTSMYIEFAPFHSKLLGMEEKSLARNISEVYQSPSLEGSNVANLITKKDFVSILFKRKKWKNYIAKLIVEEFYTLDSQHLTKKQVKELKLNRFSELQKSSYTDLLDKTIIDNEIPAINENISKHFEKELTLYR